MRSVTRNLAFAAAGVALVAAACAPPSLTDEVEPAVTSTTPQPTTTAPPPATTTTRPITTTTRPITTTTTTTTTSAPATVLFRDTFSGTDALITNEFAYWNGQSCAASTSPTWQMTSGSLFRREGQGSSARAGTAPDSTSPNATSSNGNNSAVFRLTTCRSDFGSVTVDIDLVNRGLVTTPATPAVAWDGVHVFLRYQSPQSLYYVSVNRRDNTVVVKKKVPGGTSNGGTYHNIGSSLRYDVPYGRTQALRAGIITNADGSVTITLIDRTTGRTVLAVTDRGTAGGAPITAAGRVGIRADNTDISFDNFTVTALR